MNNTTEPVELEDLHLALNEVRDEVRAVAGDGDGAPKADFAGFRCEGCFRCFRCEGCGGCVSCFRCEGCFSCFRCEGCFRCHRQP